MNIHRETKGFKVSGGDEQVQRLQYRVYSGGGYAE